MCGIAGFLSLNSTGQGAAILERMTGAISHRGPDGHGLYTTAPAFLGHRRLSIVDLSGGHQPMYNEDRSKVIVFNGEVFNHASVRPELERAGHRYDNHSDTESLLHGWEEWGPGSLDRWRGMFAFVIWDKQTQRLVGARDRLGIKPFYYYWDGTLFAFASEIKALLEHPDIPAAPEELVIPEYLAFGYVSGEQTMFRGIRKLMPGHWFEWQIDPATGRPALRIERYWDVPEAGPTESFSDAEWIRKVRTGLEETVELRLMADVPLGAFLSGGVDSSAITALVGRLSGTRVKTFSVGYDEAQYSELGYARTVAGMLNTEHREVVIGPDEFFGALPALVHHEDEPICWPSSISLYFVSRLAAQHVKVVLTGEGSDELFAGYERYRWNRLNLRAASAYGWVPGPVRSALRGFLTNSPLLRADLRRKINHTFLGRDLTVESLFLDNFYAAFSSADQQQWLQPAAAARSGAIYDSYLQHWNSRSGSLISRMLYADQKTYLVELLMKQDQMSMATSIESRVPFLDHQFLALAMRVPEHLKIHGGEQKYVLKKAVEDLLPHDIIYRKKMGFPTPLRQWFRDPRHAAILDSLRGNGTFISRWVRPDAIEDLITRHRAGQVDGTDRLWRLLNLEQWGQLHFEKQTHTLEAAAKLGNIPLRDSLVSA
jgi:asparagine synthase (glutamine-hydrolysing)